MEQSYPDKSVPREINALLSVGRVSGYLRKLDLMGKVRECMPVHWRSPNQIDPTTAFTAFHSRVIAFGQ